MSFQVEGSGEVWIWVEHYQNELTRVSLGLLGKAQELCQQLGGGEVVSVLVGADSQQIIAELVTEAQDYLIDGVRAMEAGAIEQKKALEGHEVYVLPAAERARWIEACKPIHDEYKTISPQLQEIIEAIEEVR